MPPWQLRYESGAIPAPRLFVLLNEVEHNLNDADSLAKCPRQAPDARALARLQAVDHMAGKAAARFVVDVEHRIHPLFL